MGGVGNFRERHRERAQGPSRPESITPEQWEYLSDEQKREAEETGRLPVNETALERKMEFDQQHQQ